MIIIMLIALTTASMMFTSTMRMMPMKERIVQKNKVRLVINQLSC